MTRINKLLLGTVAAGAFALSGGAAQADLVLFDPSSDGPDGIYEGGNVFEDFILGLPTDGDTDPLNDVDDSNDFDDSRFALVETFFWQARATGSNSDSTWLMNFTDGDGATDGTLDAGDRLDENFQFVLQATSSNQVLDGSGAQRAFAETINLTGAVRSSFVYMTLLAVGELESINRVITTADSSGLTTSGLEYAVKYTSATFKMFFDVDGSDDDVGADTAFNGTQFAEWTIAPTADCGEVGLNAGELETGNQGNLGWCASLVSATPGVLFDDLGRDFSTLGGLNMAFKITTSDITHILGGSLNGGAGSPWFVTLNGNVAGQETFMRTVAVVPEPVTLGLLGAGLLGVGLVIRRRRSV